MRIEFTHAERPGIDWNRRELRIGSAADNDLVLEGPGIAEHHLRLLHDARGMVLEVEPEAGRVYLNARRVRQRALLRPGDHLGIGDFRLHLCRPGPQQASGRVGIASLRAVAGPLSGRVRSVEGRLDLGNHEPWPLGLAHAPEGLVSLIREGDGIRLLSEHLPETCDIRVNGLATRSCRLHDGDQIVIGPHRFVLDACVVPSAEDTAEDGELPPPEDSAGPRKEVWWLIFTAAVLALVMALLFLV